MIRNCKSTALRRFWEKGDASGIRPDWKSRIAMLLDALDAAGKPEDMMVPGSGFHRLRGNRARSYALTVSRNWRMTFGWDGNDAIDVDLEDYHGD
jgi:proteic killer suppression protein